MLSSINAFSSAATHITDASGLSRMNIHIVFTVAPADPTHEVVGGGDYSFDGGHSWSSIGTETYYEQHIDAVDERWYQAWQFDYDRIGQDLINPTEACFRVWLTDTSTQETVWLNATSDSEMHCMPVCESLIQFHWPQGYCPGKGSMTVRQVPSPSALVREQRQQRRV